VKNPRHPKTKQELVGGFDPLTVSQRPFGYRHTITDMPTMTIVHPADHYPRTPEEAFVAPVED
jgi:hypothetical protein